jgi:hypothetical protein
MKPDKSYSCVVKGGNCYWAVGRKSAPGGGRFQRVKLPPPKFDNDIESLGLVKRLSLANGQAWSLMLEPRKKPSS